MVLTLSQIRGCCLAMSHAVPRRNYPSAGQRRRKGTVTGRMPGPDRDLTVGDAKPYDDL
jgi:hypothetical protein